jgi:hypothetical protein
VLTWQNTGDPCTPETFTYVNHLFPTRTGFTNGLEPTLFSTLGSVSATVVADTNYYPRFFPYFDTGGAQNVLFTLSNKIYNFSGGLGGATLTDYSNVSAPTAYQFSFAQWREYIYACNGADLLQKSNSGAFANVASTPKLTRICAWGERLFGINNVASFTSGGTPYAASNYRYWISGIGNPEQFDAAIDSTAYTDDIKDDGGPLVACAVLRDFVVVLKKSGVYVIEDTGGPIFAERKVSDYYGCEWPDSVIELNNVLYWISPTRGGEIVAFDGTQITPISTALKGLLLDQQVSYDSGFFNGIVATNFTGITAATDGESIVWNAVLISSIPSAIYSRQLYLNVPTGRFGYSKQLLNNDAFVCLANNASQSAFLCVRTTSRATGNNVFRFDSVAPGTTYQGRAEFYRGDGKQINNIKNCTLRFTEYVPEEFVRNMAEVYFPAASANTATGYTGTPSLKIMSSPRSGDAASKPETTAKSPIVATWNSTTQSFDISQNGNRSTSAAVFAFSLELTPNQLVSLAGLAIDYAPSGKAQAGAKAGTWQ